MVSVVLSKIVAQAVSDMDKMIKIFGFSCCLQKLDRESCVYNHGICDWYGTSRKSSRLQKEVLRQASLLWIGWGNVNRNGTEISAHEEGYFF